MITVNKRSKQIARAITYAGNDTSFAENSGTYSVVCYFI